jgi:DNA invertase Pin-like site-specific DNA recombinase
MSNKQKKAFSYIRISTNLQEDKNTQQNQKNAIKRYIADKDVIITEQFEDLSISGAEANRKQFNAMLTRVKDVDTLIVYDLSRLSRDMDISIDLMRLLMSNSIEIIDVFSNKTFDLNNDNDQLQYLLGSWFSSVERKKIKARQMEGIKRYRENNHWGRPLKAFNYAQFKELKKQGLKNRQIASKLQLSEASLYRRLNEISTENQ